MIQLRAVLIFFFLTVQVYGENAGSSEREKYKVVIVGAGISGLGAATHLLKNNFTDILILEGSRRIGGRVYTAPFGDFLIEYGAQWVHGQGENVVYKMAESYNILDEQKLGGTPHFFINSASKVNVSLATDVFEKVFSLFDDSKSLQACNCSVQQYFDERFDKIKKEKGIDEYTAQALRDLAQKFEGGIEGTDDLNVLGSWGIDQFGETNGSLTVAWKNGYETFIDILLGKFDGNELPVLNKTRFEKKVKNINWSGEVADILCEDGSHYLADHVITTVSLGVLKHSAETMFSPQLPERKLAAIKSIGFDIVDKVLIQFEKRWWPPQFDFDIYPLWSDEDKERFRNNSKHGAWATEISGFHYVENQPRVLEGWISGKAARELEKLSEKQVSEGLMEILNWSIGNKYSISRPIDVTRSKWASNTLVRGSYSFRTLHSDHEGYFASDIAQPVSHNNSNPILLFAGEATHDHYFGTVNGALETGWREAKRILSFQK